MKIIGSSPRREELHELRASSRRIGGTREFATFALLTLCLAIIISIFFTHRHGAAKVAQSQPTTSAHRVAAPNRKPQPNASIASAPQGPPSQDRPSDQYTAWAATAAGGFGTAAENAENFVVAIAVDLVWNPVFGLSNQIVGYVADTWVNPVTGDRIMFNAAPGASRLAVSILAFTMVGVVMLALASPLYASWKSWRLSRENSLRGRLH